MSEIEERLVALGRELELPAEPDVAPRVLERLERRATPFPWRAAALAFAVLALAVGIAFAVPQARSAILRFFHLGGATVVRVEALPPALERSQAGGLGEPLPRAAAEDRVGFTLLLPPASGRVYVLGDSLASVLVRAYGRPVLLSEFEAPRELLRKLVTGRTRVERVRVGGSPGLWLQGGPHVLQYLDRRRGLSEQPILIHGNVLFWTRGRLTLRLEGELTRGQALELARRIR